MPTLTPDAVLRAAALILDTHPEMWGRQFWFDPKTGCRCVGGLIAYVIAPDDRQGDPYRLPRQDHRELASAAVDLFEDHVRDELDDRLGPDGYVGEPLVGVWNDDLAVDAQHVAETMRAAADAAVCPSCRGAGGWQQHDGLIVECPRGCMTGGGGVTGPGEIVTSYCRTCAVTIKDFGPVDHCPPCAERKKFQRSETGDIFDDGHGNIAKVFRQSRTDFWVDIVVVQKDFSTWSKRMPAGIPAAWRKLPRR